MDFKLNEMVKSKIFNVEGRIIERITVERLNDDKFVYYTVEKPNKTTLILSEKEIERVDI